MSEYSQAVLRYFFQSRQAGSLDVTQPDVRSARRGEIGVGDVLQLQIQVDDQQLIIDAKFKVYGNPYAIAAMAWLTEQLMGRTLIKARKLTHQTVVEALDIPPTKLHTALQVEDILYEVIG
ncbi:MAG: Fe-S cluster assembly scaffold IscU [Legionellales bacterium]|nr:Fe-S cluster assembly scaffold IscU [Legionellales bacterium]